VALLLIAVLAFLVLRFTVPQLRAASTLRLVAFALPCAVVGWLVMSLAANLASR
jgi:hypothetical protein